jgi:hypothetical protein
MTTRPIWHRRTLAILAATTLLGSLTIWATQVTIATPASAATVNASPYFAGAVTQLVTQTSGTGSSKFYTESAGTSFIVPTVTCPVRQSTSYAVFQYFEGGEITGFAVVNLNCGSGTFSASLGTNVSTGYPTSGGCAGIPVASGDSINFSENDEMLVHQHGVFPVGEIEVSATDNTNGESSGCSSMTGDPPSGQVYTGICDGMPETGPVPPYPPPPPLSPCGSTKVSAFTPFSFSRVLVDNKTFSHWPTDEYDMYRYRQVGSTLEPIEQVQTQQVEKALDFTFLHH